MPGFSKRLYLNVEHLLLTQFVPLEGPGPVLQWVFKTPLLFYRLGLDAFVPRNILILTTTGRKTGLSRKTPIEYGYEPGTNTYQVMAGWMGRTDWYRNAIANPQVVFQIRSQIFEAIAEPMPTDQVAAMMVQIARQFPAALKIWQRWAQRPLDDSEASLRLAAPFFPSLNLCPT